MNDGRTNDEVGSFGGSAGRTAQSAAHASRQEGIALVTVLLLLVILTIIGIASITVTGVENRLAGFGRTGEVGSSAAESCMQTGVRIIQQTIDNGTLPAAFLSDANPAGPVPAANSTILNAEIMGQSDNNPDSAEGAPNMVSIVDTFMVRGDIDRLYAMPKAGGSLQFAGGYEGTAGGAAGGGVDILYRIDCAAINTATGTRSRITAVYACTATGETCQKKI